MLSILRKGGESMRNFAKNNMKKEVMINEKQEGNRNNFKRK